MNSSVRYNEGSPRHKIVPTTEASLAKACQKCEIYWSYGEKCVPMKRRVPIVKWSSGGITTILGIFTTKKVMMGGS